MSRKKSKFSNKTSDIIDYIKRIKGLKTDTEFAKILGIRQNTVSTWRGKDSFPVKKIIKFCDKENISLAPFVGSGNRFDNPPSHTNPSNHTDDNYFINAMMAHPIPIVGTVPAGFPQLPPDEDHVIDYLSIPDVPRDSFAMIVSGESMSPTVRSGDYAVFQIAGGGDIKSGDLVIVSNEWNELILKRFRKKDQKIVLTSDNPEYHAIAPNDHYRIIGKVIKVIRDIKF